MVISDCCTDHPRRQTVCFPAIKHYFQYTAMEFLKTSTFSSPKMLDKYECTASYNFEDSKSLNEDLSSMLTNTRSMLTFIFLRQKLLRRFLSSLLSLMWSSMTVSLIANGLNHWQWLKVYFAQFYYSYLYTKKCTNLHNQSNHIT